MGSWRHPFQGQNDVLDGLAVMPGTTLGRGVGEPGAMGLLVPNVGLLVPNVGIRNG